MKRRRREALAILLVLSIGLGSLGLAVVNGWIGKVQIDVGRLMYGFRTAGGVTSPDIGSVYNYPLYGRIDKPGNVTVPLARCQTYNVYNQMLVALGSGAPDGYTGTTDVDTGPIPTEDILVIDYASVLSVETNGNTTLVQIAAIKVYEICLNKSRGIGLTTGVTSSVSKNLGNLVITCYTAISQVIDSKTQIVGRECDVETTLDTNVSMVLEASWSVLVGSADGQHEYYRGNRTLATWMFTPAGPTSEPSLPSVSGDFYCFWGSQPLSVASSTPFYIDIPAIDPAVGIVVITAGTLGVGIVLVAWCFHHDRLDRARGSTPPEISASDEEGHL